MKSWLKILGIIALAVIISFGISACDFLGNSQDDSTENSAYGWYGNGSSNSFTISNAAQLTEFANIVSGNTGTDGPAKSDFTGKTVTLTEDIDMSGISWRMIGYFNGTFDGNNKTISNFHTDGEWNSEFFQMIEENGIVKNIVFLDINIILKHGWTVLIYSNRGLIQNININGSINADQLAGVVVNENYGIVEYCNFSGSISGGGGGVVCTNSTGAVVRNCYVTGSISGNSGDAGGIVVTNRGTVQNCYSTININGRNDIGWYSGGIVGDNDGTVENCYATGSVSGNWYVGGIVGDNRSGIIRNCVALNPSINITVLGRIAYNGPSNGSSSINFSNNYALNEMIMPDNYTVIPNANGQDGADVSAEDAATQSWWTTNLNWDFSNVWEWDSDRNLPKLR